MTPHHHAAEPEEPDNPQLDGARLYQAAAEYGSGEPPEEYESTDADLNARRRPGGLTSEQAAVVALGASAGGTGPSPLTAGAVAAGVAATVTGPGTDTGRRSRDEPAPYGAGGSEATLDDAREARRADPGSDTGADAEERR